MWEQYKKTLVVTQLFIVVVCATMWYYRRPHPLALAVIFVVMEVASFLGAWFGARLKQNMQARDDALPLERRRP